MYCVIFSNHMSCLNGKEAQDERPFELRKSGVYGLKAGF